MHPILDPRKPPSCHPPTPLCSSLPIILRVTLTACCRPRRRGSRRCCPSYSGGHWRPSTAAPGTPPPAATQRRQQIRQPRLCDDAVGSWQSCIDHLVMGRMDLAACSATAAHPAVPPLAPGPHPKSARAPHPAALFTLSVATPHAPCATDQTPNYRPPRAPGPWPHHPAHPRAPRAHPRPQPPAAPAAPTRSWGAQGRGRAS